MVRLGPTCENGDHRRKQNNLYHFTRAVGDGGAASIIPAIVVLLLGVVITWGGSMVAAPISVWPQE